MTLPNNGHQNGQESTRSERPSRDAKRIVDATFTDIVQQNFPDSPSAKRYGPRDWPASTEVEALEDADTHFTPPRPARVVAGGSDPVRFWAMVGAMLGPVGAIVTMVFRAALGPSLIITALLWFLSALFVISLFTLLAKMPAKSNSDMHDDGGAVV